MEGQMNTHTRRIEKTNINTDKLTNEWTITLKDDRWTVDI
jgi:hypothetical protein